MSKPGSPEVGGVAGRAGGTDDLTLVDAVDAGRDELERTRT